MTLYLTWDEDRMCTTEAVDDGWDRGTYDNNPHNFRLNRKAGEGIPFCEPDTGLSSYWVVYNIYSDGDTFGTTYGNVDAFWVGDTIAEAEMMHKRASEMDYGYFGGLQTTEMVLMQVD